MFRRGNHKNEHLSQDELALAANGGLSAEKRERTSKHLAACAECSAQADEVRRLVDVLRHMPQATPLRPFALAPTFAVKPRRVFAPRLSVALAAASLVALAALVTADLARPSTFANEPLPQVPVATPGPRPLVVPPSQAAAPVATDTTLQPVLSQTASGGAALDPTLAQRFRWWPWELALAAALAASATLAALLRRIQTSR